MNSVRVNRKKKTTSTGTIRGSLLAPLLRMDTPAQSVDEIILAAGSSFGRYQLRQALLNCGAWAIGSATLLLPNLLYPRLRERVPVPNADLRSPLEEETLLFRGAWRLVQRRIVPEDGAIELVGHLERLEDCGEHIAVQVQLEKARDSPQVEVVVAVGAGWSA